MIENTVRFENARGRRAMAAVAAFGCMALLVGGCSGQFPQFGTGSESGTSAASAPAASSTKVSSGSGSYNVTIGIKGRVGRLGAVQFDVTSKIAGNWKGAAAKVACVDLAGAAMQTCNNKGKGRLSCALIDPNGIGTPTGLARCTFQSSNPVSAADFTVKVVDASNTAMKRVNVSAVVTGVKPG